MLAPFVFLPLAAVLINDVKAEPSKAAITVDIATSDPVAASDVRVASGGSRRMYVYLEGSAAKHSTFGDGAETIFVHPRLRYTKLEIPTSARCGEPIGIAQTASGVRVRATCRDGAGGDSLAVPLESVSREHPRPDAPRAALARGGQASEALRAALALPAGGVADDGVAEGVDSEAEAHAKAAAGRHSKTSEGEPPKTALLGKSEGAVKTERPVETAGTARAEVRVAQTAPGKTAALTAPAAVASDATAASSNTNAKEEPRSTRGVMATVFAVVLLLGLGVGAAVFTRRRITRERMIRIVETASIGPRRSLVVAAIGGRTMVLGVSEAGVALLDSQVVPLAAVSDPGTKGPADDAALGLRSLGFGAGFGQESRVEESKHEGSLLARMFQRKRRAPEEAGRHDFDELFKESLEDEDLRRKLALGEPGRVA